MAQRDHDDRGVNGQGMHRREFLAAGAAGVAGLWSAGLASAEAPVPAPRVKRYVPLGKTGLSISDISFGSSRMRDPAAVRHAFERGVNYFDSAEGYKGGDSETAIGEALHDVRDRVFLTSKTKAEADATRADMMQALEGSLRRLRTDHVDVYFNHAVNSVDRMQNEEWAEFTELAKQQGKIRFRGMSGHGAQLVECLEYSLDHDLLDVILVAYNFGQDPAFVSKFLNRFDFITLQPDLPPLLARAHAKGVGVVAMKTLMGGRANDMRPWEKPGGTFAQAAFRWTLSNPDVDALVISMNDAESIDEYLVASGSTAVSRPLRGDERGGVLPARLRPLRRQLPRRRRDRRGPADADVRRRLRRPRAGAIGLRGHRGRGEPVRRLLRRAVRRRLSDRNPDLGAHARRRSPARLNPPSSPFGAAAGPRHDDGDCGINPPAERSSPPRA